MTLEELMAFLTQNNIEQAYDFLDYDYEEETVCAQTRSHPVPKGVNPNEVTAECERRRLSFAMRFDWIDGDPPTREQILRLFNQVNTFYAEKWAMAGLTAEPQVFLKECGRLILYRQGKRSGFRTNNIAFGIRKDLDFMDPFRQFQFLRGVAPNLINQVSDVWAAVAGSNLRDCDCALLLAMALIAIHPFSDGNGRLARTAYAWLMRRWGLGEHWLAEDSTGEFLRTGVGIQSTEHLMSALILELCGGYNRIDFGYGAVRSEREDKLAADVLESQLRSLLDNNLGICRGKPFTCLRDHLLKDGHFTQRSPRFEAVRHVIR
jgi:hypothetical protein